MADNEPIDFNRELAELRDRLSRHHGPPAPERDRAAGREDAARVRRLMVWLIEQAKNDGDR